MSKEYNAFDVAQLLDVNIETVRRWIRKEALTATLTSRKEGNIITEESFRLFLTKNPKYNERAKKNGYVCISPVKISKVEKSHTRRQTATKFGGRERKQPASYKSTTPAILKSRRFSDSPADKAMRARNMEYMSLTEKELIALVDTQQKEINLLNRKLRSSNEKIGRSTIKKR